MAPGSELSLRSWSWIRVLLLMLTSVGLSQAQLDNENSLIGVYMESGMVQGLRTEAMDLMKTAVQTASAAMKRGSLGVVFLESMNDTMPENLTAVMTLAHCDRTHAFAPTFAQMGKLHIAVTDAGCRRLKYSTALSVPLVSGSRDIVQLFTDLRMMNTLIWNDITIIHDDSITMAEIGDLVSILTAPTDLTKETAITMVDLATPETSSMKLGKLFSSLGPKPGEPQDRQYMVIASKEEIIKVQDLARSLGLFGSSNQWLFVVPDTNSLSFAMESYLANMVDGDNLAFIYNMSEFTPATPCDNGFQCYIKLLVKQYGAELSAALQKELDLYFQVSEEEWEEVKPSPSQRASTIVKMMKKSQMTSTECSKCTQWGIQAAEVKDAFTIDLLKVADWKPLTGLTLFDDLFPHVTGGFRGRIIPVASVDYPPWQIFVRDSTGSVVGYTGLMFAVLNELGAKLNFSYVVRTPADGQWGVENNGKWNGMIKMIQDKEVIIGVAAFSVSAQRMKVVNFTSSIDRQPYTFMIARPKELSRVMLFMEPFTNDTWILIVISVFIMGPILYLFNRASPYYSYYGLNNGKGLFDLQNCSWYIYSSILQQGGAQLPESHSGRILLGFWWIYVLIVVTTYSGNLVAFLTFPKIENAVSTLDDLLHAKDEITWGYIKGTVLETYFAEAEGKFAEIGKLAEKEEVANKEALYDRVRSSPHAYIEWKTNLLFIMKDEFKKTDTCDFSLGREEFYYENVALAVPRDSPFLDMFNAEIKRMQTGGLIQKWQKDFWPKKDQCSVTAYGGGDATRTVSLSDMQGSFFLLFLGFCIAAVFIFAECIYKCATKSSRSGSPASQSSMVKPFMA
ncbi:ionotropic receptor 93a-like [Macrobrachium rosenbergii]|uniref:ionotropic receptor 93a-like n=1 Tax=Macrobrachium rosenbergii TaxID=79674 RepID=UPI0034D7B43D